MQRHMQTDHLKLISMVDYVIKVHVPPFLHARQSIAIPAPESEFWRLL